MKLGHVSDLHFGKGRNLTPKSKLYLERHMDHLRRVTEVLVKQKIKGLMVAGDIFDGPYTNVDETIACYTILREWGEICQVIVEGGNHDIMPNGTSQLERLKEFDLPNVTIASTPTNIGTDKFPVPVLVVPWTGIKKQEAFDAHIMEHYKGESIIMFHECIAGISTDMGFRPKGGVKIPDIQGVLYWAGGDIHKYQKLNLDHAFYCGSQFQQDFGDLPGKGMIVIDVQDEFTYVPKFVKIPSHIELKTITDLSQIEASSKTWYKLVVPANQVPAAYPDSVKVLETIPIKFESLEIEGFDRPESAHKIEVDYTDGLDELLKGFEPGLIDRTKEEVQKIARV